jgi:ABC-2 type transport system permease protein
VVELDLVGLDPGRPSVWSAYRALFRSRLRAQLSYRGSFALDVLGSMGVAATNLAEVYVVFHNVPIFGGLDFDGALMVFAISQLAFGLADAFAGNLDTVPNYIRTGTLDVLLLRPLPLLGQLLTADVTLKRVGQASLALAVLLVALTRVSLDWTPEHIALLVSAPISGALIFAALFLLAGAVQFWLLDAAELTSSFTYSSSYASSFSTAILPRPLRAFFSFVVPASFVGYLPTVNLLGLPGPPGLPSWLGWCSPLAALAIWGVALLAWRSGLRHYAGAGG